MPAKVVRVIDPPIACDVQPLIKRRFKDGTLVDLPVITNVPIAMYRSGQAFVSLPVKPGDTVDLRFCERALEGWLNSSGDNPVDPVDGRKFDLSDAIAYPGIATFQDPPLLSSADNVVIRNGFSMIELTPNGQFAFRGALFELMATLKTLAQTLATAQMAEISDPATPTHLFSAPVIAQLSAVVLALEALEAPLSV